MRNLLLISTCLVMSACATTKPAVETAAMDIEVRPVTQSTEIVETPKFDAGAALTSAKKLQKSSNYVASYDAYSIMLFSMDAGHESRAQAMLGLADSALSLSWHGEKYQSRAHKVYTEIAADKDNTPEKIRRAKSGLLLLDLADFTPDAAEKRLRTALQDSSSDPRLWNALGKVHDGNEAWLDALDAYVKAMTAAKKNGTSTAAVVNNMGMSLLMQGRKKEALSKFKQARKANPDMPVYDNNLRLAQTLSGKTDKAVKGLSETRAAQIYNDAGVIAEAQGKPNKAAELYKKALEVSPIYFELAEKNLAGLTDKVQLAASLD